MLPSTDEETDVGDRTGLACGRHAAGGSIRSDSRFSAELHTTHGFYDKISEQRINEAQEVKEAASVAPPVFLLLHNCCHSFGAGPPTVLCSCS